jgi:hypothetical protein
MNGPTQKSLVTIADYKAAEARLKEAREAAVEGFRAAQERGDVVAGEEWRLKLEKGLEDFKCFRDGLPRDVRLSVSADRILESFSKDTKGFVSLVIPMDVSDEEAMHALNFRFRELFPEKIRRFAIREAAIDEILNSGGEDEERGREGRRITMMAVVPGTTNMTRGEQKSALEAEGLSFSHPIEQALAAAAYACMHDGKDLFYHRIVRGSVPGFALDCAQSLGVRVSRCFDSRASIDVAASATPARRSE